MVTLHEDQTLVTRHYPHSPSQNRLGPPTTSPIRFASRPGLLWPGKPTWPSDLSHHRRSRGPRRCRKMCKWPSPSLPETPMRQHRRRRPLRRWAPSSGTSSPRSHPPRIARRPPTCHRQNPPEISPSPDTPRSGSLFWASSAPWISSRSDPRTP